MKTPGVLSLVMLVVGSAALAPLGKPQASTDLGAASNIGESPSGGRSNSSSNST